MNEDHPLRGRVLREHMDESMEKYTEPCITREICRSWASCRRVQLENSIERPTCNGVRATILTHLPIKLPLSDGSLPMRKRNIVEITSSARFAHYL